MGRPTEKITIFNEVKQLSKKLLCGKAICNRIPQSTLPLVKI